MRWGTWHLHLIDLFVQGFDTAVDITPEVKFFEVKLDESSPAVPFVVEYIFVLFRNKFVFWPIQSTGKYSPSVYMMRGGYMKDIY
jgi:hypothetical protein